MNISIRHATPNGIVEPSGDLFMCQGKTSTLRNRPFLSTLVVLVAGVVLLLCGAPSARADRVPPDCTGSGLGINLFTSIPDVHIGDTLSYSVNVFNGIAGSDRIVCDATGIVAFIVTPDGKTNTIALRRTTLHQGEADFYPDVVSYVVRAQDIRADGSVRATAEDEGDIHQNDTNSRGGGNQGVNTEVNQPCILITGQCVGSVGENGAITFTGTVSNCGNNTLVGVTVTNFVNGGSFTVLFPTNLAVGQTASFSGSWIPLNPCAPSTAILVARGTDEFTSTPRTMTSSVTTTCSEVLTPGIVVTKSCPAQPVSPGQLLTFSGTVRNTGNVTLTNIVVLNDRPGPDTTVFTLASLAPGAVANFNGSYVAPATCSVTDTLIARASSVCGVAVTHTATATCPILTTPMITVTAVCPASPILPGGSMTYTGTVRNNGDITLTNVIVVNDQPVANTPVFTIASLAPGASANFSGIYTVPANTCTVTTTFSAVGKNICTPATVTNTVSTTCTVTTAPAIAVTLACPAVSASAGGPITYTGTVRNSGNITLNNVTVVNNQSVPGTVLTVASLAPGASANFTSTFTAPADACSVISSVTATGADNCTAIPVTNTASATCTLITTPGIAITQVCPASPPIPGALLIYTGTVRNSGNITLTNVVVMNNLSGTTPVFTAATLAPGAVVNFTGSYLAATICNTTSVSTATGQSVCGVAVSNTASATCTIVTTPAIVVTQTCPTTPVLPGGILAYTGTVRNTGDITLTNVVVVSDRPAANTPVFTVATLAPGASANFTGSYVTPTNCCVVSSTLQARGQGCDGVTVIDTATRTCTLLTLPKIVVTKVCPTLPLEPGDVLRYSGTVSNTGNITLVDVTIVNSQTGSGVSVLGPITLAPGETVDYTASYVVPPDFCGTDTVTARGLDSCTDLAVSSSVTTTCAIINSPRITVTQSCPAQPTPRGGLHTFGGTVSNTGDVTLVNIYVVNNLPAPNTAIIGPITLAAGASFNYSGSFIAPEACCEILNTVSVQAQDRCVGARVSATASVLCPLLSTPLLAVTRACPAATVPVGGVFVFKGTVSNKGDVHLTNVFVSSSHPGSILTWLPGTTVVPLSLARVSAQSLQSAGQAILNDSWDCQGPNIGRSSLSQAGNNTSVLGPIELAPGESKAFSGSYVVTAGSDPAMDTVSATGSDTCQARAVSVTANCAGPVGPVPPMIASVTAANGTATVSWKATSGVTYSLQYKNNSQDPAWITVPGNVTATGASASKGDVQGPSKQRFYRIVVVQE